MSMRRWISEAGISEADSGRRSVGRRTASLLLLGLFVLTSSAAALAEPPTEQGQAVKPEPAVQAGQSALPAGLTARAWAIADGKTGQLLWGKSEDTPAKAASTTKIMCAWVVVQLAEKDPAVLEEVVTFSQFAAATSGSSSKLREGEQVTVRECLYGLMLPSGNDAGNALAEHFNDRLEPPPTAAPQTPRSNFIAEMNRQAKSLGLTQTIYRSSYGDGGTADDRTTTPRDLLKLSWQAMQHPLFRQYVGTQQHTTEVVTPSGEHRSVRWTNTNQLLQIDGFDGIKTGTTRQAGACLVSSGHRGEDHLLVVVLGSQASADRFSDSQMLFEWAWAQRQ